MTGALDSHESDLVCLRRAEGIFWRRTSDSLLLLGSGESPILVDRPGLAVWDVFESPRTLAEAVEILSRSQGVPRTKVREDILPFLGELVAAGILTMTADPSRREEA